MKLVKKEIIICKIFNGRKREKKAQKQKYAQNGGMLMAHTDNNSFCLNPMFRFGLRHSFLHGKKHRERK